MTVYGILGKKYAGKDTFARMVGGSYQTKHLATKLKDITCYVLGFPQSFVNDPKLKESSFVEGGPWGSSICLDDWLEPFSKELEIELKPQKLVAYNPREVLQYIGTEYVRKSYPDYWVNCLFSSLEESSDTLIPDVRFLNESWKIRAKGGKLIKMLRIDAPDQGDLHASEMESERIVPDLVIGAVTGKLWLPQLVADYIRVGDFETAKLFDYREWDDTVQNYGVSFFEALLAKKAGKELAQSITSSLAFYYGVRYVRD